MGNSNASFLRGVKWSCLIVAINGPKLEGTCTIIDLNEAGEIGEIITNVTLLLVLVCKTYVAVRVHFHTIKSIIPLMNCDFS